MADRIAIPRPDDWHVHFRDGAMLAAVAPLTARHFARALVMPNLVPPVVTGRDAAAYAARIRAVVPRGFTPLMTLYLTETTDPGDVARAHADGIVTAVKLYPAGATTNSAAGVRDWQKVRPVLERMAGIGLPLCVHGEVTDPGVDIFDREAAFLDRVLDPLRRAVPGLRVVLEHVTTEDGLAYVREAADMAGTITAHHLVLNRSHLFEGGLRPHRYCLPVAKRERHRAALVAAATGGEARFFLGTDSAPHVDAAKEAPCGCAGCFTAPTALAIAAEVFDAAAAPDRLGAFVAHHGADFYGLPRNAGTMTLERRDTRVPEPVATPDGPVTVFAIGQSLPWVVASDSAPQPFTSPTNSEA